MRSKYGSKKETVCGIVFHSRKEAARYRYLKNLQDAKAIRDLLLQPEFVLQPAFEHEGKKVRAITYRADFSYTDAESGKWIVEDVKGFKTPVYSLKKRLFLKTLRPGEQFLET